MNTKFVEINSTLCHTCSPSHLPHAEQHDLNQEETLLYCPKCNTWEYRLHGRAITARKERVTEGLQTIGACWAVTDKKTILPNDGFDAKPSYHIHPDRTYPHEQAIYRFGSLQEIADYIITAKRIEHDTATMNDQDANQYAHDLWGAFWNTFD